MPEWEEIYLKATWYQFSGTEQKWELNDRNYIWIYKNKLRFCMYQFMTEYINLLSSPSNLIFLLWFQLLMIFFLFIHYHSFVSSTFFPGAIHHSASSEIVVKTMQTSRESRKCLFTVVKRKILLWYPLALPLLLLFSLPKIFSPFYLIKSCWSRLQSGLTTSVQVSLVVLVHIASHLPFTLKGCVISNA